MSRRPKSDYTFAAALAAILAPAAVLRLVGIRYGLPSPLLNPDEASIVPRAWELVHGGGLDPAGTTTRRCGWKVLAPFQAAADDPSYVTARRVAVVLGVGGVAAAAGSAAATAVATTHVA